MSSDYIKTIPLILKLDCVLKLNVLQKSFLYAEDRLCINDSVYHLSSILQGFENMNLLLLDLTVNSLGKDNLL